jgi:uncharacterized protein (TIGR03437 family)
MSRKAFPATLLLLALSFHPQTSTHFAQSQVRQQEVVIDLTDAVAGNAAVAKGNQGYSLAAAENTAAMTTREINVPLEQAEPFLAVAPTVNLAGTDDGLTIRYRAQSGSENWDNWTEIEIDRDVTPRGSNKISALLFLPKETTKVQFQLHLSRTEDKFAPIIAGMKVSFISPGVTTKLSQKQFPVSNYPVTPAPESGTAKYPKPALTTRTDWGCPDGQGNPRATPSYTTVTHLIVHHTAGSNSSSDWAAVVRSIWNFHIFTNGWSDLGYNYLIDPNGVIYEGRSGGDDVLGAHFSCQNSGTMGVALLGTFTSVQPTAAALNSLKEILSWKADQRNIDPAASSFHNGMQAPLANISGHRDGNGLARSCTATECPGEMFYPLLPNLRTEAKSLVSPANDFSLTTTLDKQQIAKGSTVSFSINSATLAGSSQTINLSLRNLPSGLTSNFAASTITTGDSTQLSITVPETTTSGTYTLQVIGTGTTKRAVDLFLTVTGSVASVSAASYLRAAPVASESIVSAFGVNLAAETKAAENRPLPLSLADVSVKIKDSAGTELAAPLFFVSPTQINYQVPPTLARGKATVTVLNKTEVVALGTLEVTTIAPGLFSANANGQGAAIGALQRRKADGTDVFEPLAQFDATQQLHVPRALDLQAPNEQHFLTLYGTGIRFHNTGQPVTAQIGGTTVEVLYAGNQQEFIGLDQVNLRLTPALVGRGTVELRVQIEGQWTNALLVNFK